MQKETVTTVALPVRDMVVFPEATVSLFVSSPWAVDLAEQALESQRSIFAVCQKNAEREHPAREDVYDTGTLIQIVRIVPLADSRVKLLVRGLERGRIEKWHPEGPTARVRVAVLHSPQLTQAARLRADALALAVRETLERISQLGRSVSPELVSSLEHLETPGALADAVASNLYLPVADAQRILEAADPIDRLEALMAVLTHEAQVLTIRAEIQNRAREEFGRSQREFHLREQLRAIRSELGEQDARSPDVNDYEKKITEAKLPAYAEAEARKQLKRLDQMHSDSAESSIIKNYLDCLCELPWAKASADEIDITKARTVLNEDHYDLEKIKQRIVEHLGVLKLKKSLRGQILCFVGPPGVGKTSLGKSIARAMGRKFHRISVGGVRDEAEIRGHRRTYVGAMPGRIIQGLKTAGANNPVFMLDEIDKVGSDFRGDPASALLEVLDPEQNAAFTDHFLGIPFDLSGVFFIATANDTSTIPSALLDRMEVVELAGYSEEEKLHIARQYLIPKQVEATGLPAGSLEIADDALSFLINAYTRESGLRNLDRVLGSVCRKLALPLAEGEANPSFAVSRKRLEKLLGPPKFDPYVEPPEDEVGVVTGLAWTPHGGEPLYLEVQTHAGKRGLILSGQLGDVMKESANTALSYVRTRADLGAPQGFLDTNEIHIHAPEGAIPKDGPSAGIAIAVALLSILTGRKVRKSVAMTGEITLRGKVLPVGGLKEKFLAARRIGTTTVVIPWQNQKDLVDIPPSLLKSFRIVPAKTMDDVIPVTLAGLGSGSTEPAVSRPPARRSPSPKARPGTHAAGQRIQRIRR
ncbi:MAG: endopeptidase La [Deltaproteobacteria bacterium]|nr:endopeptidase La [Deltaproteobacteria bacterium]